MIIELSLSHYYVETVEYEVYEEIRRLGGVRKSDYDPSKEEIKLIAHIEDIPLHILNQPRLEKKFHQGIKAMVEKIVHPKDAEKLVGMGIVNIHIPSSELFSVSTVTYLENSCTDILQEQLDKGFRIIACIPHVGNRRPDYILGKGMPYE